MTAAAASKCVWGVDSAARMSKFSSLLNANVLKEEELSLIFIQGETNRRMRARQYIT